MWLVAHNQCWTADRLARRGLPHPARCPLCDQEEENIQHLLIGCVFARQFWYSILHYAGLSVLAPQPSDTALNDWWRKVENCVDSEVRKGLNLFIILGTALVSGDTEMIVCSMELHPGWVQPWFWPRRRPFCGAWHEPRVSPRQISEGWVRLSFWTPIMVAFLSVKGD